MPITIADAAVAEVFDKHTPAVRDRLLALRSMILDTAASTPGVGPIAETLKWGQISYLTPESRSGTTIRIDARADGLAMFVNCQTDLTSSSDTGPPILKRFTTRAPAGCCWTMRWRSTNRRYATASPWPSPIIWPSAGNRKGRPKAAFTYSAVPEACRPFERSSPGVQRA
jgi:hypothetical protein